MKERPILFSGAMVRAILSGQKTVTRRVVKPALPDSVAEILPFAGSPEAWMPSMPGSPEQPWEEQIRVCPYGKPGDRLWVRETFAALSAGEYEPVKPRYGYGQEIRFAATDPLSDCDVGVRGYAWRPSIHMPRWACRILLEVTDVRVERLQDITYEQAAAEGIQRDHRMWFATDEGGKAFQHPEHAFAELWRKTGGDWHANPWVWVVEFKRMEVPHA